MKLLKLIVVGITATSLFSCASKKGRHVEVTERIGNAKKTPSWTTGAVSMIEEGGKIIYIETVENSGDVTERACISAAEARARSNFVKYLKDNITSSGQLNEISATNDPAYESFVAYLSQGSISGASPVQRYWERVRIKQENGDIEQKIRCAAQVGMSKVELQKQLANIINGANGDPEVRRKLLEAQKSFLDNIGK